ncbi:MAG: hypothetical protein KGJ06_07870 [Pseudomonadota bacterium]|nr:hypothetical protein [Pseudomonadota bacterium]
MRKRVTNRHDGQDGEIILGSLAEETDKFDMASKKLKACQDEIAKKGLIDELKGTAMRLSSIIASKGASMEELKHLMKAHEEVLSVIGEEAGIKVGNVILTRPITDSLEFLSYRIAKLNKSQRGQASRAR